MGLFKRSYWILHLTGLGAIGFKPCSALHSWCHECAWKRRRFWADKFWMRPNWLQRILFYS